MKKAAILKKLARAVFLWPFLLLPLSCNQAETTVQKRPMDYDDIGQFDSLITTATSAFRTAVRDNDTVTLIYAASSLAQAYLFSSDIDSVGYYLSAVEPYIPYGDPRINTYFYNTSGIYSLITDLNYVNALEYYLNGYDAIESGEQYFDKIALLLNISLLFYAQGNAEGMQYVETASRIAQEHDAGPYYMANIHLAKAQMHYLRGEFGQAEASVRASDSISTNEGLKRLFTPVNTLSAELCAWEGRPEAADSCYAVAFEYASDADPEAAILLCMKYGDWCRSNGKNGEALKAYSEGLDYSDRHKYMVFRTDLLKRLSDSYYAAGDSSRALHYARKYIGLQDSTANSQKERDFNRLLRNRSEREYNLQLLEKERELMREEKKNAMAIAVCIIIIISISLVSAYLYRQKKNSEKLVAKYFEYTKRGEMQDIAQQSTGADKDYADSNLFMAINEVMKEKELYMNKNISLQTLSDELGTNKTYISASINKYAGMSFYRFVDTFRIKRATEIISMDKTVPFKKIADDIGYNSPSVFYSAFYRETGVTPGTFRNTVHRKNA